MKRLNGTSCAVGILVNQNRKDFFGLYELGRAVFAKSRVQEGGIGGFESQDSRLVASFQFALHYVTIHIYASQ